LSTWRETTRDELEYIYTLITYRSLDEHAINLMRVWMDGGYNFTMIELIAWLKAMPFREPSVEEYNDGIKTWGIGWPKNEYLR
jgi:hypothetical protein